MTFAARCGAQGVARDSACAAVLARLREAGLEQVRVAMADLHGHHRSKALVASAADLPGVLAQAFDEGVGMVSTLLLKDSADRTAFPVFEAGALAALPGFGAANNLLLLPDPASFTLLPWAPRTGWLRGSLHWADGAPVEADPRHVLQRALAELAQAGYGLRCGLEVEFHIHRIEDDGLATDTLAWPPEPPRLRHLHPGYRLLGEDHADLAHEALAIVRHTALALGLPLRSLEVEFGPSQFEAVFAATDALTAADHLLAFRNGVRQALRRAGYHASFACRPPFAHSVASGWHLHQSLVGLHGADGHAGGANAMASSGPQGLSDAGLHWLAGLLAHARGLAALCAPTVPAYARYRGSVMAPQAAVWGRDNRGAMLRVIGAGGDPATRIENRLGEPAANPYLSIAAQVFAGLHGLQQRLPPPPATETPYAAETTQAAPLPASLGEALDALAADAVLQRGLGAPMARVFDTVKRQELAHHAASPDKPSWERRECFGRG